MAILSTLANLLLPLTTLLSLATLAIGLCACPMQSLALQHAFVYFSVATLVLGVATLYRHGVRSTPYVRRFRIEIGIIPLVCFWGLLLLVYESRESIREANIRTQMHNNGKQIGLAAHSIHDVNKHLPADIRDPAGLPLLSWRLHLCPYLEEGPLYRQFDQTKPWDNPANFPLVEKRPYLYRSVFFPESPGNTPWQGFAGPGTAFDPGNAKLSLDRDFPDGTSNTILVVEAQQQVPWSKPADIPFGPGVPLPSLGHPYLADGHWPFCCRVQTAPRIMICMMDGTVRMVSADISEAALRALILRNDGGPAVPPD